MAEGLRDLLSVMGVWLTNNTQAVVTVSEYVQYETLSRDKDFQVLARDKDFQVLTRDD
jgi:hypothetical protein